MTADASADQLAADVRAVLKATLDRALDLFYPEDGDPYPHAEANAVASLDALVARLEAAERERDEARVDFDIAHQEYIEEATAHGATRERAEAAEAALAEARQALATLLDVIVSRWHESKPDFPSLPAFMELTAEQYAMFVEQGPTGYVRALAGGGTERVTHGRHCICSACAREDWTRPELAPCGMHGPTCSPVYAPLGAPGDIVAAGGGTEEAAG